MKKPTKNELSVVKPVPIKEPFWTSLNGHIISRHGMGEDKNREENPD